MANIHTHDWWHFGMSYMQLYIGIKHTTSSIRSSFQWTDFLIFHFSTIHLPEIIISLIAANLFSAPAYFFVMIFLKLMFKKTHFPLKLLPASINYLWVFDRPRNWLPGSRSGFQRQGGDVFTGACYAKETLWFQRWFSVSCWLLMNVYYAENEECDRSRYPKVKCYQWLSRWWFQRDSGFLILQFSVPKMLLLTLSLFHLPVSSGSLVDFSSIADSSYTIGDFSALCKIITII